MQLSCLTHKSPGLGVCLHPRCQNPQRILCFECVLSQIHLGHNSLIVDFNNLEKLDQNYTFIESLQQSLNPEITLKQNENLTEGLLDQLFQQLRTQIIDTLERTKIQIKSKLQIIEQTQSLDDKHKTALSNQNYTSLVMHIKKVLEKLKTRQVDITQFSQQISQLINSTMLKEQDNQKYKVTNFDEDLFKQLSKNIIQDISNLNTLLNHSYQHVTQFQVIPENKNVLLACDKLIGSQSIKFISSRPSVIYCDTILSTGMYQFRLRVDRLMEGHICIGLIPMELKEKWSLQNCYPNFNINGIINKEFKYVRQTKGLWTSNGLKQGSIIVINIDLKRGIFQVTDSDNIESIELDIVKSKYKQFRVYLFDYDGKNNEFTLLRSGRIV